MKFIPGRLPHDPARLAKLPVAANYAPLHAPPDPNWTRNMPIDGWGMYLNDHIGDCTCAAVAHARLGWASYTRPMFSPTAAEILALYMAISGYVPGEANTDRGATCADVLTRWQQSGVILGGKTDKLLAFGGVNPKNRAHLTTAVWAYGYVYAGVVLHKAQETEAVWSDLTSPVAGGHCVLVGAINETGPIVITWGQLRQTTWPWWNACAEEAYALLSQDWIVADAAPPGLKADALIADLAAVGA